MLDAISNFTELLIPVDLYHCFDHAFIKVLNDRVAVDSLPKLRKGLGSYVALLSRGTNQESEMIQQRTRLTVKRGNVHAKIIEPCSSGRERGAVQPARQATNQSR